MHYHLQKMQDADELLIIILTSFYQLQSHFSILLIYASHFFFFSILHSLLSILWWFVIMTHFWHEIAKLLRHSRLLVQNNMLIWMIIKMITYYRIQYLYLIAAASLSESCYYWLIKMKFMITDSKSVLFWRELWEETLNQSTKIRQLCCNLWSSWL